MVLPLSLVVSICKDLREDITWCSRFVASSFPSIDIISATEGPSWNWWKMIIRKLNLSVKSQRILHPTQKLSPFNYLLLIFSRSRLFSFMHILRVVYYMCVMFHLYWLHFREMWTDGQDDFFKPPQTLFSRVFTTVWIHYTYFIVLSTL